ncbi:MAG TPA: DUF134 domain-containing protein [Melioribacteraceae bacterium]|nr:DUF134 domain-containing protein [Melioribacteraceae bacterium]
MPRPKKCRKMCCKPQTNYFKPRGIPINMLTEIVLSRDEFDALKLSDIDKLSQEDAAIHLGISRQTYGRILISAHQKVALAIVNGLALKIEH